MSSKAVWTTLAMGGLLVGASIAGSPLTAPVIAATPPPTPPALGNPATPPPSDTGTPFPASTPIPVPSGFGLPGASVPAQASATPSPPPNARKGLEGVWEVQIQRGSNTDYAHFLLRQDGTALNGTYLNDAGKKFPLAGSVDGQSVRLIVSMPDGTTLMLEGRLDGTTDMIGMLTSAQGVVGFTAAYRPKEKFIDNLNASPGGGLGGLGGGPSGGGGGGYPP